jgi:hypothetical protein
MALEKFGEIGNLSFRQSFFFGNVCLLDVVPRKLQVMNESRELNRLDAAGDEHAALEKSTAAASVVPECRTNSLFSFVPVGDGTESMLQIRLSSGGDAGGQSFAATFRVCQSPTCGCGYIGMECRPMSVEGVPNPVASVEAMPLLLDIDVLVRGVKSAPNAPPATEALALAVAAEIQDADWRSLTGYLQGAKRRQMETMNLATLNAWFPPEVVEDGAMVGYREVFPWADVWTFESGEDRWFVGDEYCVQPGCDCTEVRLVFFRPGDDAAMAERPSTVPDLCIFFNYKTGRFRVETATPDCPADRLISVLRKTCPSLGHDLAQRHRQLQQLGRRLIVKRRRASKLSNLRFWGKDPQGDRPDPPQAAARANAPVAGRNDPCPCGSGGKYKKCCMAADERSNSETRA